MRAEVPDLLGALKNFSLFNTVLGLQTHASDEAILPTDAALFLSP